MKIWTRDLSMPLLLGLSMLGCGGGESPGPDPNGLHCYAPYVCSEGDCACFDGPKKDEPCCDPEDTSCDGGGCEEVCKYCE